MFNVFPVTITEDGRKVPLIKDWQTLATRDENQIKTWQAQFLNRLTHWGIPTGSKSGILVLDVDVKTNGYQTLKDRQLHIPQTMSQRTMSGGMHYLFRYPNDGKLYGNRTAMMPGLDIRGEGGFIVHYGLDHSPIVDAPHWLLEAALKPQYESQGEVAGVSPSIAQSVLSQSLDSIRNAPQGERNNTLNREAFKIGQLVKSGAVDATLANELMTQAAKDAGLVAHEIKQTINSGVQGGHAKPITSPFSQPQPTITIPAPPQVERWTPHFFQLSDLTNISKLRKPQLFEDWSTEDIHVTTADGGTGKTTLKLFEAICLALGQPFLGFANKGAGKTLFITGEDTAPKLGAMIGMICKQMGVFNNQEQLNTVLSSIVVKKDSELCIIQKDRFGFLQPNELAMNKVLEAVYDINPRMIVFDPISSFWGSEAALNDMAKAVSRFMSTLVEQSNACVEMINHMGKQSSQSKDMTQFAGRGGTGIPSHARVSRVLRTLSDEEYSEATGKQLDEGQSSIMCNVNKFSDGSPLYNKPFIITRRGYLFERVTIPQGKKIEETRAQSDIERVLSFVHDARVAGRYPTKNVTIAHFMSSNDKMSKERVVRALDMLTFLGHENKKLRLSSNPDITNREQVYIITDQQGNELN